MRPWLALLILASCKGGPPTDTRTWTRETTLTMASSHRCHGKSCTCREGAADAAEANPPAAGMKRYELRVAPSADFVWLDVDGHGAWFKETEAGQGGCVYVDLPAGAKVKIAEHVEAQEKTRGTALDLRISEYNPKLQVWYDTARIECGGGGTACNREMLADWIDSIHKLPRGLHDACGSTKIEEPRWMTPETDLPHPPAVTAELTLHVYQFEPKSPPGTPDCGKRHIDNQ